MIELRGVSAKDRHLKLDAVSLSVEGGVFGVVGAAKDGTGLLFDVLEGAVAPRAGTVRAPRVARVPFDAPLPDALTVEEMVALAADVRGEPRQPAKERLDVLGAGALARRRGRSLSVEERRTVAFAIAVTSTKVDVVLVEEPLLALVPAAPPLVHDALRRPPCAIVASASPRDVARLADRHGTLTQGVFALAGVEAPQRLRVVVRRPADAGAIAARLEGIAHVELVPGGLVASGAADVPAAVTRAIAEASADVDLVEALA